MSPKHIPPKLCNHPPVLNVMYLLHLHASCLAMISNVGLIIDFQESYGDFK